MYCCSKIVITFGSIEAINFKLSDSFITNKLKISSNSIIILKFLLLNILILFFFIKKFLIFVSFT